MASISSVCQRSLSSLRFSDANPSFPVLSQSPFQTSSSEGFELDLHNCFSSFIVHYEKKEVPWFERTWGPLFTSFDSFLSFGWATMGEFERERRNTEEGGKC